MQYKRKLTVRRNVIGKRFRGVIALARVLDMDDVELADLVERGYDLAAMKGGTTSQNTVLASPTVYYPRALVVSSDQTINQGDMVRWDSVNYTLKALTDPTQVAYILGGNYGFAGIAGGQANPNVYPAPAAGTPSENLPGIVVHRSGSHKVKSTTGEGTYFPFEPVTVGADAQTISRSGVTAANRVGFVIVPPPVSARGAAGATPAPETIAAGQAVELWPEVKFPTTALL